MQTIKSFNEKLNQSDQARFELWKVYRKQLTDLIVSSFGEDKHELLIIGAGNSEDIDLSLLSSSLGKIYLSDIDEKAMMKAVSKYEIPPTKVKLLPAEYTGLAGHVEWRDFVTEAVKIKKDKDVHNLMKTYKSLILNHTFLPNYEHQFERIIVSPIYSQLLFQQLQMNLQTLESMNYSMYLINLIRQSFLNLMSILLDTFNKNVSKLLTKGGKMLIISDIYETKNGSDFYQTIKTIIHDNSQMEQFYERYQRQYGKGLGDYGLQSMSQKISSKTLKWMIWPFSEKRSLIVKVVLYEKH